MKGCVFPASNRLIKQINGFLMGGPTSAVLSNIYFFKMEEGIVAHSKPFFCKPYVGVTYVRRKKQLKLMNFIMH